MLSPTMAAVYLCLQGEINRCQMSRFRLLSAPFTGDVEFERIPGLPSEVLPAITFFFISAAGG